MFKQVGAVETSEKSKVIEMTGGAVNIPLKDGKSVTIPVDKITYNPKTNEVNISEEMSKTAIWKQLVANESDPNLQQSYGVRHRWVQAGRESSVLQKNTCQF